MSTIIKYFFNVMFFSCLLFSCTTNQENEQGAGMLTELTKTQQAAFDALNTLQVRTDEKNHLYSTFPNIEHPSFPPDTSFVITQAEFLDALEQFGKKHLTKLSDKNRVDFINDAVMAQSEYKVLYCLSDSADNNYENGIPMKGTWVIPGVLDRRDILLVW